MSTVSEAARKQARYKEISEERQTIERQIAELEERDSALNREQLELLGAEFNDGNPAKSKTEKPPRERKPRGSSLGTIRESVVNGVEGIGVYPNAGSLDDVKASILAFLRRNSGERYHAHEIAQALQINGGLVSKALLKLDVLHDGERRGKLYWVEAEVVEELEQEQGEHDVHGPLQKP